MSDELKPDYYPSTLPFRVWCKCGHISGQHGSAYPHCCACDGNHWIDGHGSVCDCQAFQESTHVEKQITENHCPF